MNQLDAMRTFLRVAELGSFAAVANQLGTVRSVVTRQVAALEEHLGVKLMVRSTRSLTLTTAGAALRAATRSSCRWSAWRSTRWVRYRSS